MASKGRQKRETDELLALALAAGGTLQAASQHAQISERTARRRMQDPAFRQLVTDTRSQLVERAVGRLAAVACQAADCLADLVAHGTTEAVRLNAAKSILANLLPHLDAVEFERRLRALEDQQAP